MKKRPLYFDCDPGVDDALALAYLLNSSEVSLVGIGTICSFIRAAVPEANIPSAAVESLQCTTEFYISSDLRSFSYNCIRFVLVSNTVDDLYALLSVKGNQASFSVTDIEFSYKKMSVRGNINADFDRLNDIIFTGSLVINSIGYQVQGFFSQNILNISSIIKTIEIRVSVG